VTGETPTAETIFYQAIELNDEARARFVRDACRDSPQVRCEVEQLLADYTLAQGFLEQPAAVVAPTIDLPPVELPGTQIGPYKLLEQIGEGGMGIVYVASQKEPLRRKVALKIIKPGMDTREVVARFEAERQALAMMDHPNIAKVFDAGATDAGRPYFAMELVQGTPITEYCDRQQLSTRERLELFITLCHGVQHAHQKGVIHRDLKPSNLLIEVHDVRPVPKIIDFGIAKAMGQQLTEKTFHTGFEQMVGTPLYMSPEQAGQSCTDVDTRSDIYSLGVLLYELLTGSTPFEKDTLRTAGFDEMRRIIREVDPPRPSARVSTLQAADLSTISERRHIEPRKLSQELRGELDWIVMKAMDKDRDRRYATVNDLAADVERYLRDEPVQACPPSVAYRFTKFARRNQFALVTSAMFALILIVGTGVSVWQAIRATNAELVAIAERDEKEQQTLRATLAEQQTAKALLTAEDRLQVARKAVDDWYVQVAEKWLSQQAEPTPLQKQFLENALAFYQRLATEESEVPSVRLDAAKAQQRVGNIQRKLGHHKEAEATFRQGLNLSQQLVRENPDEPQYRQQLALTHKSLAGLLSFKGRFPEAERELRLALEIMQTLAAKFPGEGEYQKNLARIHESLGLLLVDTGRSREAEAACRQSIAILESLLTRCPGDRDQRNELAGAQATLARVVHADKPAEAEALFRAAINTHTALKVDDPKNVTYRASLAACHNNLGFTFMQLNRQLEAETSYRLALSMYTELVADVPENPFYCQELSTVLHNLASILGGAEKSDEAKQLVLERQRIWAKLAADYPDVPEYQSRVGDDRTNLAYDLMEAGKLEEARDLLKQAIAQKQAALKSNPDNPDFPEGLAVALDNLGVVLHRMGRLDEAITALRSALEFEERVTANTPSPPGCQEVLRRTSSNLAQLLEQRGQLPEAEVVCRRSLEVSNKLVTAAPDIPQHRMDLACTSDLLGRLCQQAKKLPEAEQAGRRAVELQNALAANRPDDAEVRRGAGAYLSNLASTLMDAGKITEARQLLEQAVMHQQAALKIDPENALSQEFLGIHQKNLAELQTQLNEGKPAPEPAVKVEEAQELPKSTPAPEAAKEEEQPK
jgi:serine/threonine protein kinase/tetratricopeptide (TPR) repeat protein